MSTNKTNLENALKELSAKYAGKIRILSPKNMLAAFHVRRPTGILSLDIKLNGGFPGGSINQIHGPDGVGKDALTNYMIAENQRIYGDESAVFWVSFGYAPDLPFWRMCGIHVYMSDQELELSGLDPNNASVEDRGDQVGHIVLPQLGSTDEALEAPSENIMDVVADLIKTGLFQLGIVNELGSGESKDDVQKSLKDERRIASWSRLVTQFCSRFYTMIRQPLSDGQPNLTTLMVINPVRANMDSHAARYKPFTQTSGNALAHAKAVDLHLRVVKSVKVGADTVGKIVGWKVSKGKHGIPEGDEGTFTWVHGQGVDLIEDTANVAKVYGVMRQRGAVYEIAGVDGTTKGGIDAFVARLRGDDALLTYVRDKIREALSNSEEESA